MSKCPWFSSFLALLVIVAHASAARASQQVLQSTINSSHGRNVKEKQTHTPKTAWTPSMSSSHDHYDKDLFTPVEYLSALSETEFTSMWHPEFPNYGVRIKKSPFCDGGVKSYTGYIDIEARHLFFYFFESRNDPDKDDGQGVPPPWAFSWSSFDAGPCRISDANGTKYHPESWNSNANVFFVDQPIGVGYSYADYGEEVGTTEEAAKDIAAFVAIFFENFNQFKGRPFHMTGESYGGRYIPLFAAEVYDQNARLLEAGLTPINLTSAVIGNGWTETSTMVLSYYDMQCTAASVPPILDIASCVRMKQVVPRCEKRLKESCLDVYDEIDCTAASTFCANELAVPFSSTGKNPYDISRDCDGELEDTLCYPVTKYISNYLDSPSTQTKLGVDPSLRHSNYTLCSAKVSSAFSATLDVLQPSHLHVAALLERGIRVLIYVGTYDWICNWVGNERWTLALEWTHQREFVEEELRVWEVDGKRAGRTRSAGGLTFATVEGAGHMVPYDKPKEALELINRWMASEPL
ncbi:Carboxypeptidase Y [Hypsizygus marmoreus]|uniref:Carboxypeptidase n=1 Tax=Hypsizygus marmoreus TaxID=39966 RepID=A0A369K147_HYPMA|nr:Carboxypeptidase Y [Hypsizygus marmoreus]